MATKTKTQAPAKAPEAPAATETAPATVAQPQGNGLRRTQIGFVYTTNKVYRPATEDKKAWLRLGFKTRLSADQESKIIDLFVYGKQAEFLNEHLINNIQVVVHGVLKEKQNSQTGAMEPLLVANDNYGICMPIRKRPAAE